MTQGNINWFLHAMLFYHTKYVIQKQMVKECSEEQDEEEENLGLDEEQLMRMMQMDKMNRSRMMQMVTEL